MQYILNKYHRWFIAALFLIYLVNGLIYIPQQSIMSDEGDHFDYAIRFVKGHPEKIKPFDDASTMPVSALNTIPRVAEQLFHPGLKKTDWGSEDIVHGRYITLLISLLIGLYVYLWSKDLFGKTASVVSLLLFVFCPNIAAHAGVFGTDVYSALFTIVPLYHFWKYSQSHTIKQFVLFSIALALAQLCKQSLTFLYPIFLLLFLMQVLYKRNFKSLYSKLALRNLLFFILIQLFILNAGFQFKGTGKSLSNYSFRSHFFQKIQQNFHFIGNPPLPVPSPYLEGLDCTKTIDEMGPGHPESSAKVYLLGKSKEGKGFWNYYFVVLFFKTPIPLLLSFF
ncbi:MAG: glycosyltransferase family 39 protein, partial [Bacteroidetes bacterium]